MESSPFREMPGATKAFTTIQISATASYDGDAMQRLWEDDDEKRGGRSVLLTLGAANAPTSASDGWGRYTWKVWWAPPSHYRDELSIPGVPTDVAVVRRNEGMLYLAGSRTLYTNGPLPNDDRLEIIPPPPGAFEVPTLENRFQLFPLIQPPLPSSAWQFATVAERELFGGRVTRRVRVTRRSGANAPGERLHPGYMPLVDEYECIVDDERRIILRFSAISSDRPIAVVVADDVRVDSTFPPDIFEFTPPDGARIARVARFG